ncbi:ATP-dependent DNA helicase 2 subunit 1-like [Homarus americanus]|uniref:ATP-dependent DNA helicase 2 subunit 1 n=1 Tax=Homarus americanus TaxID=6706 RepID=A0A8J5TK84_HOMAM|nr:ATP-dependent DNA helicase 2 subunit 1-like [Homarus americanus]
MMYGSHFGSSYDVGSDEAEGEIGLWAYRGRLGSVFLIDTAKEMFVNPGKEEDGEEPPFYQAVRAAHSSMMRKVFSNDRDVSALVLFNTRETKNHIDLSHVYTLQDLECPDAERVLATSRLSEQNILLFTCRDDPHSGDSQKQRQARKKAQDLKEAQIELEVLHMGENFNVNKFYKDLIILDVSEDNEDSQGKITLADPTSRFEELLERVRRLDHKQHTAERVMFTLAPGDEVSKLKQVYDAGIHLLGFKPISSVKLYYHVRSADLIYPDEKSVKGSTKMFAALLERCIARKVVAIVRFIPRKGATVSLAALVPQAEKLDNKNCQVTPPGFVVSHLPFADDFCNIKLKNATRATPDQVDAAKLGIKKNFFKYSPQDFNNPDIPTHLRNIEALAPNRSQLDPCITKKWPAATSSSGSKRAKSDPVRIDVAAMTKVGKAHTLTVDVLRAWLQIRGISINAKRKADLVLDVIEQVDLESLRTHNA